MTIKNGGAVYIYSSYDKSFVLVKNCSFHFNEAFNKKPSNINDHLYGGSSAFFTVRNLNITECQFNHGKGSGGSVKILAK